MADIVDSAGKVDSGARHVGESGSTMGEIVQRVSRVTQLIGAIGSATAERSSGVGQVSLAVVQLDQLTQQNAVLVEQSAAATATTKSQAGRLAEAIEVFSA